MKYSYLCKNCDLEIEIQQNSNAEFFYRCPACYLDTLEKVTINNYSARTIIVDIDGVLADKTHGGNYAAAEPLKYGIEQVNKLTEMGFHTILYTARYGDREHQCLNRQYGRGYVELVNWLNKHNVKYGEVWMGKPAGILYIDDKAARVNGNNEEGWAEVWYEVQALSGKDKYGNKMEKR